MVRRAHQPYAMTQRGGISLFALIQQKTAVHGSAVSHYKGMKKRFTFSILSRRGVDTVEGTAASDLAIHLGVTIIMDVARADDLVLQGATHIGGDVA